MVVLYQSRAKQPVGFRTTVTFNPSPWLKNPTWCCWVWIWCPACDSSCAVHCEIKKLFNAQHILLCSSSHLAAKSPPRAPEGHPNRLISRGVSRRRFFSSLKSFSSVPAAAPPPRSNPTTPPQPRAPRPHSAQSAAGTPRPKPASRSSPCGQARWDTEREHPQSCQKPG